MPDALATALKIAGAVVAPTTLLTGLLFYFGRQHATALFRYLGVQFTVLDFTAQDYLVRSVDGLFVPLAGATAAVLVVLWLRGLLVGAVPATTRRAVARAAAPSVLLVALVPVMAAVAGIAGSPAFGSAPEVPGLCLAGGAIMLTAGVHMLRRPEAIPSARSTPSTALIAEWGALFVVVAVGLFWAVGNYAAGVGRSRAVGIEQTLDSYPDVVLYTEKALGIRVDGVVEHDCSPESAGAPPATAADADAAYGYRYDGLKLIIQSGDQYLFLPAGWTQADGTALLVPRTDSLRLEFTAPGQAQGGSC